MIDVAGLIDKLVSHAMSLGIFEKVNTHEPKSAPGRGLNCAIWIQTIEPVPRMSGLASTSGRLEFRTRLYMPMSREPEDDIDPAMITALDTLMDAYSGDFDLGESVVGIDLLGAWGTPLSAQAGYLPQDNRMYRVLDITLPVILADVWDQEN